jgi:TetR/AcrR family transcriptional regulator
MPKLTFFNLPDEKREQILQVAIEEFADNDFASASVSRIVARAGIAKGSFYQYFTDKEDLYAYLLELLASTKNEFLSLDHPDPQHVGVFVYLHWLARAGVAFELAHPALSRIGYRAMLTGSFPAEVFQRARQGAMVFYRRLVELGIQQGDIAADLDPEVAAFIFDAVLTNLGNFWLQRLGSEEKSLAMIEQPYFDRPDLNDLFTCTVSILEHGMGRSVQHG